MTGLKTSIKTITYLSDIGCLEIQGASLLMELKWTSKALSDLARLYDFLVLASKPAAARTVQSLTQAPVILLTHPRMGEQLFQFEPREVRRIFAGEYRS